MNFNYEIYRMNQSMSGSALTQEESKEWIANNICISKIGIIKSFNSDTQEGVVEIEEYKGLEIHTRNISNINLSLHKDDKVVLLQSSINLFNTDDNIYFDKHHFYILSAIDPKYLKIYAKHKLDIRNEITSLKDILEAIVSAINNLRIIGNSSIDYSSLSYYTSKINSKINNLFN
ncbi:DUF777 family protein [Borrelia puertoricensis]|uniref:DUF777 family protein n=1 Tax=Borrelia puertoricensis TaxID=2756107 RepID=UPI001FF62690|nr:DUF777 family protein [Borrelia puertoricensis]UPA18385.1 DUF777 family protein [Borrelia puertoricensis]